MAKILLVEDNIQMAEQIVNYLKFKKHYVELVSSVAEAFDYLSASTYSLVILDRGLPDLDGLFVCSLMRKQNNDTPVLVLTGRDSLADKLEGFNVGVDDYLTKPFHLKELLARIESLLRRASGKISTVLSAHDITLNQDSKVVSKAGHVVVLSRSEYQVLEFLLQHLDEAFSNEALLERLWPATSEATAQAVKATIKRLKTKIDPNGEIILNSRGFGHLISTNKGMVKNEMKVTSSASEDQSIEVDSEMLEKIELDWANNTVG